MLLPYNYTKIGKNSYEFITSGGIKYRTVFIEYGYLFYNYADIQDKIFTFNIEVIGDENTNTSLDERVGMTIAYIFSKFFENDENAVIYICDNLDERHWARKRKFDYWYWKYSNDTLIKEDGYAIIEGTEIISSIILRKDNPNFNNILFAFAEINRNTNNK